MIQPTRGLSGQEQATCTCDVCGRETVFAAKHGDAYAEHPQVFQSEGAVYSRLQKIKWARIKKSLHCPDCVKRRKEKMKNVAEVTRQPTKEQKREIIDLLMEVYDTTAQRYNGSETDKTVADTIGNGILFGWVAQLREDFFGPDGNEINEQALKEVEGWMKKADDTAVDMHKKITEFNKQLRLFNELRAKVENRLKEIQ